VSGDVIGEDGVAQRPLFCKSRHEKGRFILRRLDLIFFLSLGAPKWKTTESAAMPANVDVEVADDDDEGGVDEDETASSGDTTLGAAKAVVEATGVALPVAEAAPEDGGLDVV